MRLTKRQIKYYILYCVTQLTVWFFWASNWAYLGNRNGNRTWCGLYMSREFTFTSAVLVPFLLGLLIFSIIFLPFYLCKEE